MQEHSAITLTPIQLISLLAVFLASFAAPLTIPFNIGAIIAKFGATGSEAGLVATVEGISFAIAAVICSRILTKVYSRPLVAIGLLLVAAGNAISVLSPDISILVLSRVVAGLGAGTAISVVMASAARTAKPEMTFGMISAASGLFIAILSFTIPLVINSGGFEAAYATYSLIAVVGFVFLMLMPNTIAPEPEQPSGMSDAEPKSSLKTKLGWLGLFGLGILFCAQAGVASFVERIGTANGLSLPMIGYALMVGGLLTIVGPLLAGFVGARFGSTKPLLVIGSLICLAVFLVPASNSLPTFFGSVPLIMVLPAVLLPSFLGGLAVIDPSGRLAGAQPAFASMGGSLGPVAGGFAVDNSGFAGLGVAAAIIMATGLILMLASTIQADKLRAVTQKIPMRDRVVC